MSKSESKTKGNQDIVPEKFFAAIRLFSLNISTIPMIQSELKSIFKNDNSVASHHGSVFDLKFFTISVDNFVGNFPDVRKVLDF